MRRSPNANGRDVVTLVGKGCATVGAPYQGRHRPETGRARARGPGERADARLRRILRRLRRGPDPRPAPRKATLSLAQDT